MRTKAALFQMVTGRRRYDAFISYSHQLDSGLATALQAGLERYARPIFRARALRVFRDATNLAASPELWADIERALSDSEWFVLMAAPGSAHSPWVQREVDWWLTHRSPERMLLALTDGEIVWDGDDFDWTRTTALPHIMSGRLRAEPLWVDLRPFRKEEPTNDASARPDLGDVVAEFAAPIRGVDKDELVGQHIGLRRRIRRTVQITTATLTALLLATVASTYLAIRQRDSAATANRIAAASKLAAISAELLDTQLDVAMLLAVEAYQTDANPKTRAALLQAATHNQALVRYVPVGAAITAFAGSLDGSTVAVATEDHRILRVTAADGRVSAVGRLVNPTHVAVNADGSAIAAANDTDVIVWPSHGASWQLTLPGATSVAGLALGPSGSVLAVAPAHLSHVLVADLTTATPAWRPMPTKGNGMALPADDELLTFTVDGRWARTRISTGDVLVDSDQSLMGAHGYESLVSPNGEFWTYGVGGLTLGVWRTSKVAGFEPDLQALTPQGAHGPLAVSSSGSRVAYIAGGTIYVTLTDPWAPPVGPVLTLPGVGSSRVAFLGDDEHLVSANGDRLALWDLGRKSIIADSAEFALSSGCNACPPPSAWLKPDGSGVAVIDGNVNTITYYDFNRRTTSTLQIGFMERVLGWSSDGSSLNVIQRKKIIAFDPITGKAKDLGPADGAGFPVATLREPPAVVLLLENSAIDVRSLTTGEPIVSVPPEPATNGTPSTSISQDDRWLAQVSFASGDSYSVRLIDLASGTWRSIAESTRITQASAGTDYLVVSRGTDVDVYEEDGTQLLYTIDQASTSIGTGPHVVGGRILAQLSEGSVVLTNLDDGQVIGKVPVAGNKVGIAINSDGTRLVTVAEDEPGQESGQLAHWKLGVSAWIEAICTAVGRDLTDAEWTQYVGEPIPRTHACQPMAAPSSVE